MHSHPSHTCTLRCWQMRCPPRGYSTGSRHRVAGASRTMTCRYTAIQTDQAARAPVHSLPPLHSGCPPSTMPSTATPASPLLVRLLRRTLGRGEGGGEVMKGGLSRGTYTDTDTGTSTACLAVGGIVLGHSCLPDVGTGSISTSTSTSAGFSHGAGSEGPGQHPSPPQSKEAAFRERRGRSSHRHPLLLCRHSHHLQSCHRRHHHRRYSLRGDAGVAAPASDDAGELGGAAGCSDTQGS